MTIILTMLILFLFLIILYYIQPSSNKDIFNIKRFILTKYYKTTINLPYLQIFI